VQKWHGATFELLSMKNMSQRLICATRKTIAVTISHQKTDKKLKVEAHDNGKLIGYAYLVIGPNFIEADDTDGNDSLWVDHSRRRQGIADQMYDYAEKTLSKPVIPSEHLSGPGQQFWEARLKKLPEDHPAHDWF